MTAALLKNAQQRTEELENPMLEAESAYVWSPDPNTLDAWLYSRREYELRLLDLTQKLLHVTQKTFEHGNRADTHKDLGAPLSVEEIAPAIWQLPAHKTPGLDGFPTEWYTHLWHLLCPLLLSTCSTLYIR